MAKHKVVWTPRNMKYKLYHKLGLKKIGPSSPRNEVLWGQYGLKVLIAKRLTLKPLEAARRIITRQLKKREMLWIRAVPSIPVTAKPIQIRMGKGKGAISYWVYNLRAGSVLFELGRIDPTKVYRIFHAVMNRIGAPTTLVVRHNTI